MVAPSAAVLDEYLGRCSFPAPGTTVTCAVSGGADSSALLALAVAAGCSATAVHVDHGLRPESAAEADVVARLAQQLGADFSAVTVEVDPGSNLEARARAARYAALPTDVLTGHTADDRAETVLINLMRGAGRSGRSPFHNDPRRPIVDLRRAETEAICALLDLDVVTDPTNRDARFLRNRVRHELLPAMNELVGRDLVPLLCRQAEVMGDDDAVLDELAAGISVTDAVALAAAPRALGRRRVRQWLAQQAGDGYPPDLATVDRVLAVAAGDATGTDVGGGWQVRRTDQVLRLERTEALG